MHEADFGEKASFLAKMIDDTQSTIRFVDTKIAFGIAIVGGVVKLGIDGRVVKKCLEHGCRGEIIAALYVLSGVMTAWLAFKTVFPTVNPATNVGISSEVKPCFFLSGFRKKSFTRFFRSDLASATFATSFPDFEHQMAHVTSDALVKSLEAEALKTAFIRQLKLDRSAAFAMSLFGFVTIFGAAYLCANW